MRESVFESERFIPFTPEQLDDMRAQYEAGKNTYEIGSIFGIDPGSVRRRLRIMGVEVRTRGRKPKFTDDECFMILQSKEANNLTIKVLAERHGCSDRVICDALLRGRAVRSGRNS